jgi:hypothetical protein
VCVYVIVSKEEEARKFLTVQKSSLIYSVRKKKKNILQSLPLAVESPASKIEAKNAIN